MNAIVLAYSCTFSGMFAYKTIAVIIIATNQKAKMVSSPIRVPPVDSHSGRLWQKKLSLGFLWRCAYTSGSPGSMPSAMAGNVVSQQIDP
jgi:hypothetical protein